MDRVDTATRSRIMRAIKSKDTKPETRLRVALSALGVEHSTHAHLPGSPDVKVGSLCVFVHGCFWHCCRRHYREPKSKVLAWRDHMAKNVARDLRVRRKLNRMGLRTMVVWEHEDASMAAARVLRRAKGTR